MCYIHPGSKLTPGPVVRLLVGMGRYWYRYWQYRHISTFLQYRQYSNLLDQVSWYQKYRRYRQRPVSAYRQKCGFGQSLVNRARMIPTFCTCGCAMSSLMATVKHSNFVSLPRQSVHSLATINVN